MITKSMRLTTLTDARTWANNMLASLDVPEEHIENAARYLWDTFHGQEWEDVVPALQAIPSGIWWDIVEGKRNQTTLERYTVSWSEDGVTVDIDPEDYVAPDRKDPVMVHDGSFVDSNQERGFIDVTAEGKRDALMLAMGWLQRNGILLPYTPRRG